MLLNSIHPLLVVSWLSVSCFGKYWYGILPKRKGDYILQILRKRSQEIVRERKFSKTNIDF